MKKILFFASALVLTSSLFAQGVEIHSKTDVPTDTEAGISPITPSRSVTLKGGQYLDIIYPGTGWIYLGEMEGSSILKYEKRETGEGDTFFTLQARGAGKAILHFYKSDALAGNYIDDYLDVTVSGTSRNAEHVTAPSYADIVPPRPSFTKSTVVAQATASARASAEAQASDTNTEQASSSTPEQGTYLQSEENTSADDDKAATVIQTSGGATSSTQAVSAASSTASRGTTASTSPAAKADNDSSNKQDTTALSEEEVLALARTAYEEKDYALSLSYLEDFFDKASTLRDEGLYLKGKVLEAPSSSRNIKEALASYRAVVSNYPESDLWDDAAKRISYIERIYLEIR
ncbi:MAG: hypothetical protein K6G18_17130 [Treponema sp.]|nr:hypothetical protein [Treponema sp.]